MVRYVGQSNVTFSGRNMERRTKMIFCEKLNELHVKNVLNSLARSGCIKSAIPLIKCISLNCILKPRRYAEVGCCHPKHCHWTIRGRRVLECGRSRIPRIQQRSGSKNDRPYSGRPRITNPIQDRYIWVFQLRHRTITAPQTASNTPGIRRISAQHYKVKKV